MRRSFRRLVIGSVLTSWTLGFLIIAVWSRAQSWVDHAQRDGTFLLYDLLDETPPAARVDRLAELQQHSTLPLALWSVVDVERRVGRSMGPGERAWDRVDFEGESYFQVFNDGQGALVVGPVIPASRTRAPIGILIGVVFLPGIAVLIALRVDRELSKVERVSEALAVGDLSARVDDARGPSGELASKFNAMAERIEQLVRRRDELVQAVSHELGSPLARLRFHVELLGNQSDVEREDRLLAMTRELDALDDLVGELLSYVQSDDLAIEPRHFDPGQGLRDLAELAVLDAPVDSTVHVEAQCPPGARVFADPRLFMRAVENLLRNAVRYANTSVRVDVQTDDDQVCVTVHDDGPGIPQEIRTKVVTPFYRADKDRARKTGGVGLGLAIADRVLRRHGGELRIGDSPLGGASVSTIWPRHAP